jgi:hypothetical protein
LLANLIYTNLVSALRIGLSSTRRFAVMIQVQSIPAIEILHEAMQKYKSLRRRKIAFRGLYMGTF